MVPAIWENVCHCSTSRILTSQPENTDLLIGKRNFRLWSCIKTSVLFIFSYFFFCVCTLHCIELKCPSPFILWQFCPRIAAQSFFGFIPGFKLKGSIEKEKKKPQKILTCLCSIVISAHCECCDLQWQLVQVLSTFISEHLPEQRLYSNDTRLNVTIKIWKMWCVLNDINKLVVSQLNLLRSPQQSSQQSSENNEQTPCVGGAQACTTCQVKVKQILICSSLPRQHPKFVSTRTIMYFHTHLNWEINVNLKKSKSIIPFIC